MSRLSPKRKRSATVVHASSSLPKSPSKRLRKSRPRSLLPPPTAPAVSNRYFEENPCQILKQCKSELRELMVDELKKLVFPSEILSGDIHDHNDVKLEILAFTPSFGLNMDTLCMIERTWFDMQTAETMSVDIKNVWIESKLSEKNSAYLLFTKLKMRWNELFANVEWRAICGDNKMYQIRLQVLLYSRFEHVVISTLKDITGFEMQRGEKCKYFGSAAGCVRRHRCPYV
eukprot:CAMPEP_0197023668 /NCGR_PEP_ID=MMETSP1384-20130603/4333_1 /TAXON_ID=29189 /ORGANISM="Ammonia sp." /LENGTH=229 /DNA_ID=CAMNT_0042451915 /DNA_START=58 /DNA_END=743 /DNA_ORIENTATION=+